MPQRIIMYVNNQCIGQFITNNTGEKSYDIRFTSTDSYIRFWDAESVVLENYQGFPGDPRNRNPSLPSEEKKGLKCLCRAIDCAAAAAAAKILKETESESISSEDTTLSGQIELYTNNIYRGTISASDGQITLQSRLTQEILLKDQEWDNSSEKTFILSVLKVSGPDLVRKIRAQIPGW